MIRLNYVGKVPLEVSQVTPVYGGDSLLQSVKNRLSENDASLVRSVILTKYSLFISLDADATPPKRGAEGRMINGGLSPIIHFVSPRLPLTDADKPAFVKHINEKKYLLLLPGANLATNVADWILTDIIENFFTCPQSFHASIRAAPGVITPRIGTVVKSGKRLSIVCPQCTFHFRFPYSEEESIRRQRCRRCGLHFLCGLDKSVVLGENIEALANLLPLSANAKKIARKMFSV